MENNERIIGYRLNTTGSFGYEFYKDKRLIIKLYTGSYSPNPGIFISFGPGAQCEWNYEQEADGALIIRSQPDEEVLYRIRRYYWEFLLGKSLKIEHEDVEYRLVDNYEVVAQMVRALNVDDYWRPEDLHPESEPFIEVLIKGELRNDTLLSLFCAFPMLVPMIR